MHFASVLLLSFVSRFVLLILMSSFLLHLVLMLELLEIVQKRLLVWIKLI